MKIPAILALTAATLTSVANAEPDAAVMASGQTTANLCMACHGPDGQGAGVEPAKLAPSLTASKIAMGDHEAFALALLKGIAKVDTKYVMTMLPLEASFKTAEGEFDAKKMADLMTFVRNSFGNEGDPVTAEEAQAAYEKYKDRVEPATREELAKLSEGAAEAPEGEETNEPGE